MFEVYVLISEVAPRTYTGQTDNLAVRLRQHNSGKVFSTKRFCPWQILHTEVFETRSEAMRREKWFKSRTGRVFIKELLKKRSGTEQGQDSPGH